MNKYTIVFLFVLTLFFFKIKRFKINDLILKHQKHSYKDYIIPKVIHKIIIVEGYKTPELPIDMEKSIESFKTMNPEYTIKIYNGNDCLKYIRDYYSYEEEFIFQNLIPYAYKCDLMKYLILCNEGGIYSDMKMICLHPFDKIFPENMKWFSAIDSNPSRMANGFIISVPNHPILLNTIEKLKKNFWNKDLGIDNLYPTGPTTFQFGFEKYYTECIQCNKTLECIINENEFSLIKTEIKKTNEQIVQSNNLDQKKKLETKKNNLNCAYFLKKKKLYSLFQQSESVFLGQHTRDKNNILYFYDNKGNKIIKTKYTNGGEEFSAGEWDKFPQIKGNNYNILWLRNQVYSDKNYPLYYDRRFKIFSLLCLLTIYFSGKNTKHKYIKSIKRGKCQNILNDIKFIEKTLENLKSRLKTLKTHKNI